MATKKSTGSKLADMMYGNPEQAAFGVYPQAGKRGQRKLTAKEQLAQIFSDDRAMELPKLEDYDLSVPTMENLALSQRISARQADLKRQSDQAMSPLEKLAGGMQAGRLIGSGMYQAVKSLPTAITKGGKAAEEYIAENIYKPNQPKAYEYAEDVGNFLQSLESDYKIPPIIPEAMVLQNLVGPATRQGVRNLSTPSTLNSQAGVFIGPKAKTWNQGRADMAVAMEEAGRTPQEIWQATGTFRGADGILRQEIDDRAAKFLSPSERQERIEAAKGKIAEMKEKIKLTPQKDLFPKALIEAKKEVLDDISILKSDVKQRENNPRTQGLLAQHIFEHPELYAAYPELQNVKIVTEGGGGNARGSLSIMPSRGHYPGSMEMDIYDAGLRGDPTSTTLHEMQHAVQTLEGMGPGGNSTFAFQNPEAHGMLHKERMNMLKGLSYDDFVRQAGYTDMEQAGKDYIKYTDNLKKGIDPAYDRMLQERVAMEYYKRLLGEAEARAVQDRQLMTPSQRMETPPPASYDVPQEDLIVKPPREYADGGAVFGVTPMIGKRREDRQDRQAAKSFPLDLARGVVAGAAGMPGDIESLIRMLPGLDEKTILPTSEDVLRRIPFGSDTPVGKFASGLGILGGGSLPVGPAIRGAKAIPGALKAAARNVSTPSTLDPQAGVIKTKGGNWLGGSIEKALEDLKRPDRATGSRSDPKASMAEMKATYTPEALSVMSPETQAHVARAMDDLERKIALNNWVDSNLYGYIKNDMATPQDPVRLMIERRMAEIDQKFAKDMERVSRVEQRAAAETDPRRKANFDRQAQTARAEAQAERDTAMKYASHMPQNEIDYANQWIPEDLALSRMNAGFPTEGLGQSNTAKGWEAITDSYIHSAPAGNYTKPLTDSEVRRGFTSVVDDNPWLSKLDPDTQVQYLKNADSISQDLRLDHIMDVLREDVATGRIRPEQLSKVSMEQAVRRTAEYDQELAKKMRETAIKQQEGFPLYKEYPEGYRWIELAKPQITLDTPLPEGFRWLEPKNGLERLEGPSILDPQRTRQYLGDTKEQALQAAQKRSTLGAQQEKMLEDALKYEGDTMGHCVGGYCPDVLEGKSRIYSLRDAKGEPHVTVEVRPQNEKGYYNSLDPTSRKELLDKAIEYRRQTVPDWDERANPVERADMLRDYLQAQNITIPSSIVQIKGKQNRAPKEDYLPFVQDFVRSGKWSDVGDLQNTGLVRKSDLIDKFSPDELDSIGVGEYLTKGEQDDLLLKALNARSPGLTDELGLTPPEGMAHGGRVHISDDLDVMQLELAGGGLVKKAVKAAVKTPQKAVPLVEAPSIIIPGKVSSVKEAIRQSKGDYGARRVERAADEVKNLERLYKERALIEAFGGDNAKVLMTMNPADFENYAMGLPVRTVTEPKSFADKTRMSTEDYLKYLRTLPEGFDDVPFLEINKQEQGLPLTPFISGHEGRHRNRAMAESGEQSGLVRLIPRAELREPFPRRSQEEYIEALKKELEMTGNLVLPEHNRYNPTDVQRPAVDLPDVYADGGAVHMQAGGLARLAKSAAKGMQNILPAAEREANKAKFLEQSKVPQRLYHGTTATEGGKGQEAIKRIKPSKEGALGSGVYLTPNSAHASGYSGIPNDEALAAMAGDPYAKRMADQFMADRASGTLREGQEGGNMLPVHAQLRNPLILEGKGDPMIEALTKLGMDEDSASRMVERAYEQKGYIGKQVQQRAQAAGYDGLLQYRDGDLSEVVSYNPNAVKSAIGNQGTYDINDPDLNKAAGGAVQMSGGGALAKMGAKGAAKGAKEAAVPLSLPRVRPSMQEILEAAERVGKQQAGEFVKTPLIGKTHNLAGRSKKEVDRLKEMEYKVTPIKDLPKMKPYEAQVGEVNIALPGDQTISDMLLESVDGIPVGTTSEGGALFGRGRLADPEDKRAFWASNIGPVELFQKKVTELADLYNTDMVTAYHLAMGQMSNNFAQHMADANLRAIDYSKLNKDKMNAFDRVVSKGYVDPTTKERVTFENWPGIASPEDALLAMKEDPKLRKWFNNRMKTEDVTKKSDLPYGKSIEWAMTEPELRNMEINLTGLSAGRMKPGAELIPDSAHQTYSHDIPGTALGRAPELSPFSISFPDATAFVREKYRPQDFTGTIQKVFPHQVVDEAYLDDMYKYYTQLRKVRGFKKGGAVQSYADGGEITADDLILEERKL